jgi:hypothetical protein
MPEPPPSGARARAWDAYHRRRRHDALLLVSSLARAARISTGPWAEVRSIALLSPHDRLLTRPVDSAWITIVGKSYGFDVSPHGDDYHLLPQILELCRAPLPPHWTVVTSNKNDTILPTNDEPNAHEAIRMSDASQYTHVNVQSGEVVEGHPLVAKLMPRIKGLGVRAARGLRSKAIDSWLQLVDDDGSLYFLDLRSGEKTGHFPLVHGLSACVLPPRTLEPSAEQQAKAGEAWLNGIIGSFLLGDQSDDELDALLRAELWEPRLPSRAAQLAHEPCPLEAVVLMGHYLGIDACLHPGKMWLVDCALSPELPIGWMAVPLPDGTCYYAHAACGLAQWEHPQTAFLTGVVRRLPSAMAEGAVARERKLEADRKRAEANASPGRDEKKKALDEARALSGMA